MISLSIRLDFCLPLISHADKARKVGEILTRPCFASLDRVSARRGNRSIKHARASADTITEYLLDQANDTIDLDNKAGREVVASAALQNGVRSQHEEPAETRYFGYLTLPAPQDLEATLAAFCDLAETLETSAGFVAAEPNYSWAQEVALGNRRPRERTGLSATHLRERRARDWHRQLIHRELAGIEWGMFLGPGHLARIDSTTLRASGVFARVVDISDRLVFLQLTADLADNFVDGFENTLTRARAVMKPLLMDISDVTLD